MISSKNERFFTLIVTSAPCTSVSDCRKCALCLLKFSEKTSVSSRYVKADCHFTDDKCTSIARWNFTNAFLKPNGIRINWKSPWWLVNAVFDSFRSSISFCQYLQLTTNMEKMLASQRDSIHSFIFGWEYKSLTITPLSLRQSTRNLNEPSSFGAKKIQVASSMSAGSTISFWSIFCISIAAGLLAVRPAHYSVLWPGRTLLDVNLIRCFAI